MKTWPILENINAGVNSAIVGNDGNSHFSTPLPIIEEYNLDLWIVFILGFMAGIFVYWIFSSIKSHNKESNDKNDSETKESHVQHDQESD